MPKLKEEHKPLLVHIGGYVTAAIAAIAFATAYFFYSAQAGLLLEQKVQTNDAKYELHVKQAEKQSTDIQTKLDKIIDWQIEQGKK